MGRFVNRALCGSSGPLGFLSADIQLPLRDVNSFTGCVSAGVDHSSQGREGDGGVEEAVSGEGCPFRCGHHRLDRDNNTTMSTLHHTTPSNS